MPDMLPPLPVEGELEGPDEELPLEDDLEGTEELDPMFAAEAELAWPDADEDQLMAIQRAIRSLLVV